MEKQTIGNHHSYYLQVLYLFPYLLQKEYTSHLL